MYYLFIFSFALGWNYKLVRFTQNKIILVCMLIQILQCIYNYTCNKSFKKNPASFVLYSYLAHVFLHVLFHFSFFILHSVFYFELFSWKSLVSKFIVIYLFIMVVAYWPKFLLLWFLDMFFPHFIVHQVKSTRLISEKSNSTLLLNKEL